ncbi:MAG: hypothetical protein ACPK85_12200 [Methanosarcina sp.]
MIRDDLYEQREEIEKKNFLIYDNIPAETRQGVYTIIIENVLERVLKLNLFHNFDRTYTFSLKNRRIKPLNI